jgi:hypothetical protein
MLKTVIRPVSLCGSGWPNLNWQSQGIVSAAKLLLRGYGRAMRFTHVALGCFGDLGCRHRTTRHFVTLSTDSIECSLRNFRVVGYSFPAMKLE